MLDNKELINILNNIKVKENKLNHEVLGHKKNPYQEILNILNDNFKSLNLINLKKYRQKIESMINHNINNEYSFLDEEETIAINNIFGTVFGIIDARINYYIRNVEKKTIEYNKKIKELKNIRSSIYDMYIDLINENNPFIISDVLKNVSSLDYFEIFTSSIKDNNELVNYYGLLIETYMKGYNNSLYFPLNDLYQILYALLDESKNELDKNNKILGKYLKLDKLENIDFI